LNPSSIFSKTGKGVQEAGGKTSHLSRADRAVLAVINGKTQMGEVAKKFEKIAPEKFEALIAQLDKDGFIREVSSGAAPAAPTPPRPAARAPAPPAKPAAPAAGADEDSDFTAVAPAPKPAAPAKPTLDLAAAARAGSDKKAKENEQFDFRAREQAEAKAKAEAAARAKAEGRAVYSLSGAQPAKLFENARLEGNFKIEKGVLGSFDLSRALQTGGAQSSGRTLFNELNAQGVYDKGATQLRNITVSSGAMSASASLDIDAGGALNGRITAEVKTSAQVQRASLSIGGKLQDPAIRK